MLTIQQSSQVKYIVYYVKFIWWLRKKFAMTHEDATLNYHILIHLTSNWALKVEIKLYLLVKHNL